jgi:Predicted metal-dependent hydrolase with the TIM-barrel fold
MAFRGIYYGCVLGIVAALISSCSSTRPLTSNKKTDEQVFGKGTQVSPSLMADVIYFNGDFVTMEDDRKPTEALAVSGSKIIALGTREEVASHQGPQTRMIDMMGKTMMPGFVDGHSHIGEYVLVVGVPDLNSPPVGSVRSIPEIVSKMKKYIQDRRIPAGQVVYGFGYDDSLLKEKRHPTASELDRISSLHPVFILHSSGHLAVANNMMLKETKVHHHSGLVSELDVFSLAAKIPSLSMEEKLQRFDQVQKYYASYGITTAQDGLTSVSGLGMLEEAAKRGRLNIDIVSYPVWTSFSQLMAREVPRELKQQMFLPGMHGDRGIMVRAADSVGGADSVSEVEASGPAFDGRTRLAVGSYEGHLKIGGFKITQDGSPQGRTAYLSKPYFKVPAGQSADYRGAPNLSQAELDKWIEEAYKHEIQPLVHCNGDAAADMMIGAVRRARDKFGDKNMRPVMIHAQTVRDDQLDEMKELGIVPSFFSAHTYYWGDWHRDVTLGPERAARISPMASAIKRSMIFANHTDAPVVPPNQMALVDSAVNRVTRSGKVLGADQRISVREALKAVTLGSAYLYYEEGSKGSLRVGKMADLILVSANPLKVQPSSLRYIEVLETIKEGRTIYQKTLPPTLNPQLSKQEKPALNNLESLVQ